MVIQKSPKPHLVLAILLGIWLTAFLVFIGPFDTAELTLTWRAQVMYVYGLVLTISYIITIPLLPFLEKLFKTLLIIEIVVMIIIIGLALIGSFWYYETPKINGDYGFQRFTLEIYLPTNVIFLPLLIVGRWWINNKYKPPKSKSILKTEKEKADELMPQITSFMESRVYLNPELNLQDFANELGVNSKLISQSINLNTGMNFNDFVNEYRINEVLKEVDKNAHLKHTLQGIAENCGFKSKATFNRAFRKKMNVSPSEYVKMQKQ